MSRASVRSMNTKRGGGNKVNAMPNETKVYVLVYEDGNGRKQIKDYEFKSPNPEWEEFSDKYDAGDVWRSTDQYIKVCDTLDEFEEFYESLR